MGSRRYPPLTPSECIAIVTALGFTLKRQEGSHCHYERPADPPGSNPQKPRSVVTIDVSISSFDDYPIKMMIRQSNHSREEFYGATPKTKKKI